MFKTTAISGAILALAASSVLAQEAQKLERIQITGSSIKRVDSETALPVTVISREAIEKSGATNVEDVLRRVAANSGMLSDSTQGAGYATSNANMRNLGANSTLVLLNGRRLAGHPFGSIGGSVAVDLNSIPFAAIERIEVLRDGASAVYGTDAVAGVINFITRKDYTNGELTVRYGAPEKDVGGKEHGGSIAFGMGNLDTDGFNLLVTANIKEQTRLEAVKQAWYARHATEVPGSAPPTSFRAYPGRLMDIGISPGAYTNPGQSMAACDPINTVVQVAGKTPNGTDDVKRCRAVYAAMLDNLPDSTKTDLFARGTFRIDADNQWFIEASAARNHTTGRAAPTPIDGTAMKVTANGSYPRAMMPITSKYFPTALLTRLGYTPADYVTEVKDGVSYTEIAYRSLDRGNRVSDNTNEQFRMVVGANGLFSGWDYDIGLNIAQARGKLNYSGYLLEEPFLAAMRAGIVNPFGPNDAAGVAALDAASLEGTVRQSKGTTMVLDAKASRELMPMGGGMMALAVGIDLRKEKADDKPTHPEYSKGSHIGGEGSVPATSASRNISAVYSELSLPFAKGLEATVAARYDKYSDFGGSFNPRVAIRFQPSKEMLFRASAGTGFRAPTLWDVNSPVSNTNTADPQVDPECPQAPDSAGNLPALCNTQFNVRLSSDKNLKAEKSRQFAFGAVFEPIRDLSIALDYWNIEKRDQIGLISGDTLMAEPGLYTKYKSRVKRSPTGFIAYIETPVENLGKLKTSGIDIDIRSAFRLGDMGRLGVGFSATRTMKYELQNGRDLPFTDYLGRSLGGNPPVPDWQHTLSFDWTLGSWNVALENVFTKGWQESAAVVNTNLGVDAPYNVKDTSRWNLAVTYKGIKNLRMTLGARNAFDQDPPFVASSSYGSHAAGFAGSFADPRGRFIYGSVTYQFK
ncbi:TonB-dependent receptor [Roseateles asaccharophilus]|uniref:Iron complex outermembrane receptor protein n=1 Tax=Roseateles asaccharophilus TaxID=582607 RepID=A0ABU2A496_9BURK|nr:TonB-dependent receptor [Roseateles asaccharophilus]MDR7331930.1 iron complex outermembrane receptor protein [Roseateles asaccharophilus]